ncbi:peptidase M6 [Planococcus sp. YIM B11945]|uniref:peptidase M6 n=1 Tax=Planococcus sp. YIM B11945 TaxID=3435410 RepID=UPI003D7E565B
MKKSKRLSILCAAILAVSLFLPFSLPAAQAAPTVDNWDTERYGDRIHIDQYLDKLAQDEGFLKEAEQKLKAQADEAKTLAAKPDKANAAFTYDGGTKVFFDRELKLKEFTLRSIGKNVEIWVAHDLAYGPNNTKPADVITQAQVDKLRDEFDNKIYPTATDFFGSPDSLDGTKATLPSLIDLPADYYAGSDKVILLVDNIKDDNWYNPEYPFFVAGFFWQAFEPYIDRNIVTIDSNTWAERLESTFFGTTIHELQHLIQADNDAQEETWVNEGLSMFAEFLGGYNNSVGSVNFFLDHPENSLVNWDEHSFVPTGPETVADYGQVYLFMVYLRDKFGEDFVKAFAKDGSSQGIESVGKLLQAKGKTFEDVFQNFMAAITLDHSKISPDYSIDSIDLRKLPVNAAGEARGKTVDFEAAKTFEKEGVPAWGGDFKEFNFGKDVRGLKFNGEDFLPLQWYSLDDPLGSGGRVLYPLNFMYADNEMIFTADLAGADPTLTFDHYYQFEKGWDAGIVQISTDNGETWTSLANDNTVTELDANAYTAIVKNLPGFTGTNQNWTTETFDLSEYAGQKVLISFRLMTDAGTLGLGWFVDNIKAGSFSSDGMTTGIFKSLGEVKQEYVEFVTTFIHTDKTGKEQVFQIDPYNVTDKEALNLKEILKEGNVKMITAYAAPPKEIEPVTFTYEVLLKEKKATK